MTVAGRLGRVAREVATTSARAAWHGFVSFYQSDDLMYAASIGYCALLSLFPFLMIALAVLGNATTDAAARSAALDLVLRYFPQQFDFIRTQLDALQSTAGAFGLFGMLGLLWGALGVFGAVSTAVNHAWGVERARNFWQHKLFSFLMLMVAGLVLLAALLIESAYRVVGADWFSRVLTTFPALDFLRSLVVRYTASALFVVVMGLVYYFVPNTKVRFKDVWVGALLSGLLWTVTLRVFSWSVDTSRFARINGSIATVVVFLIWVYLQAVIMLYGVEFTAAFARLREERRRRDLPGGSLPGRFP